MRQRLTTIRWQSKVSRIAVGIDAGEALALTERLDSSAGLQERRTADEDRAYAPAKEAKLFANAIGDEANVP